MKIRRIAVHLAAALAGIGITAALGVAVLVDTSQVVVSAPFEVPGAVGAAARASAAMRGGPAWMST